MVFYRHRLTGLPPPTTLGGRFGIVIDLICCGIGDYTDRLRVEPSGPSIPLIRRYVVRLLARFLALVAKVQAGTLRPPRRRPTRLAAAPPPTADHAATEPPPKRPRLPGGFAWLLRHIPPRPAFGNPIAAGADSLRSLLIDPEMVALIAAAPQVGRLLRPLCHALAVEIPPALRLPPRPRRPRRPSPELRATRAAARAEAAWGRRLRRQLGLPARAPAHARGTADPPAAPVQARPPPKRA